MITPRDHTNGDNLTRRLHNLDNHLSDVFAADLDDPQRTNAFLTRVDRRAAGAPAPAATPRQIPAPPRPRTISRLSVRRLAHLLALTIVAAGVFATIAIQAHYWTAIAAATAFAVEAATYPRSQTVRRRNRR